MKGLLALVSGLLAIYFCEWQRFRLGIFFSFSTLPYQCILRGDNQPLDCSSHDEQAYQIGLHKSGISGFFG